MRAHDDPGASRGFSRRTVLGGAGAVMAGSLLSRAEAGPARGGARPVVVQVFLRGAMDGLTTVVPHGDGDYYAARPTLAVAPPGTSGGARDLDGFFGLAPAAAPLLTPYLDGRLAIVHAAGSVDPTRSHFDAFARMELGDTGLASVLDDGWLARTLRVSPPLGGAAPLRALALGDFVPLSLAGARHVLPLAELGGFTLPGRRGSAARRVSALAEVFERAPAPLGSAGLDTLDGIAWLGTLEGLSGSPANGAVYPPTELGVRLRDAAAVIRARAGVEAITIDVQGWDLHAALGPVDGAMAVLLDELARGLEAFYLDLLGREDDYVLVCLSEFGRRVAENASAGTDHGHGNALLVLGGGVNGGRVVADWPGLAPAALDDGDLAVTSDYRDVLGEILSKRLGLGPAALAEVFPGHAFQDLGVLL